MTASLKIVKMFQKIPTNEILLSFLLVYIKGSLQQSDYLLPASKNSKDFCCAAMFTEAATGGVL